MLFSLPANVRQDRSYIQSWCNFGKAPADLFEQNKKKFLVFESSVLHHIDLNKG
jgi:hypothetical protein